MSSVFAKAAFPLLLLSGGALALAGCSSYGMSERAASQPAVSNNTGEPAQPNTAAQSGSTQNPCSNVAIVSPRENGLGGHQMPPACDEYLESHPNLPSAEPGTP